MGIQLTIDNPGQGEWAFNGTQVSAADPGAGQWMTNDTDTRIDISTTSLSGASADSVLSQFESGAQIYVRTAGEDRFYTVSAAANNTTWYELTVSVASSSTSFALNTGDIHSVDFRWPKGVGGGGVTDHGALTGLNPDDDHPQYFNVTRGDIRYYTQAQVDSALNGKADDPHTHLEADVTNLDKYTQAQVDSALATKSDTGHDHAGVYLPVSHDGGNAHIDWVVTGAEDIHADRLGNVPAATTTAAGVVELATDGESAANVAVQGNDSRLSDSRAPTGAASGDLTGTYPSPTIDNDAVTLAKMASGTAGGVIAYDAAGNPVDIGAGTSTQVVTSNGSGTPSWEDQTGTGSAVAVEDEGVPLTADVTKLNFAGDGVVATEPVADEVLVTIPGMAVEDEGSPVAGGPHNTLNFQGGGIIAENAGGGQVNVTVAPGSAPVDSVFDRTGVVLAAASDYDASQIDNDSTVNSGTGFVDAALNTLDTEVAAAQSDATSAKTKTDWLTVSGSIDLDQMDTDVAANNAKVSYTDAATVAGLAAVIPDDENVILSQTLTSDIGPNDNTTNAGPDMKVHGGDSTSNAGGDLYLEPGLGTADGEVKIGTTGGSVLIGDTAAADTVLASDVVTVSAGALKVGSDVATSSIVPVSRTPATVMTVAGGPATGANAGGDLNLEGGNSDTGTDGDVNIGAANTTAVNVGVNLDVTGNITVSGTVDGIDIATDVAANTTHSGTTTGNPHAVEGTEILSTSEGPGLVLKSTAGGGATWESATAPGAHNLGGASHTSGVEAAGRVVESDGAGGVQWTDAPLGNVVAPAGSVVDEDIAVFDGTDGELLKKLAGVTSSDLIANNTHRGLTSDNPHGTSLGNLDPGTHSQLEQAVPDAGVIFASLQNGQVGGLTGKSALVADDVILLEDSQAGGAKKSALVSSMPVASVLKEVGGGPESVVWGGGAWRHAAQTITTNLTTNGVVICSGATFQTDGVLPGDSCVIASSGNNGVFEVVSVDSEIQITLNVVFDAGTTGTARCAAPLLGGLNAVRLNATSTGNARAVRGQDSAEAGEPGAAILAGNVEASGTGHSLLEALNAGTCAVGNIVNTSTGRANMEVGAPGAAAFGSIALDGDAVAKIDSHCFAAGTVEATASSNATIAASGKGTHASGYSRATTTTTTISASGEGAIAHGKAVNNQITATGSGAGAFGYTDGDGNITAGANNAFQFGPGLNFVADSLAVGGLTDGLRFQAGGTSSAIVGSFWVSGQNVVCRSGGADVVIGAAGPADEIETSGTNVTISSTAPTGAGETLVTTSATAAAWKAIPTLSKTLTIEDPVAESLPFFFTSKAITLTKVRALIQGGTSIPVTIASGTTYLTVVDTNVNAQTASNTTTGADLTIADATIAANSNIWFTLGTPVGTQTILTLTVEYTED